MNAQASTIEVSTDHTTIIYSFFFQAEHGIRYRNVTGVQTCALPILMARAGARRREFVLRTALGASRGRLLRQSVTEGAVMSGAGGILGLWLASAGVRALIRAYPTSIPRTSELAINLPVLLVALGLSTGTALLFGFVSLGRGRTSNMATALKEGAR